MSGLLKKLIFYALLGLIWEAASRSGFWPSSLFPSPEAVGLTFLHGFRDGTLLLGAQGSLQRIALGYSISLVLGIGLGLLLSHFKVLGETAGSLLLGLQSLPGICWLPIAVLWFGFSEAAIQFVVVMGSFVAIAIATERGVKEISPVYLRAAQTMGVQGVGLYLRVIFPAALPSTVTGMRLGWSLAWRTLMSGELIYATAGLWQLLQQGREASDIARLVAVLFLIAGIGILVDQLMLAPLEKRVRQQWGLVV